MNPEEVATDITIVLAVIMPPIQFGRGRKLPRESDRDRRDAARLIVDHFVRIGVKWFRRPPACWHSTPGLTRED
jgi:hypothetical protein